MVSILTLLAAWSYAALTVTARGGLAQELQSRKGSDLVVDLGYATYEGVSNNATGLNVFKGIRYATAPRFQAPKTPPKNRSSVIPATSFGPTCPQAFPSVPNAPFVPGNEDCLFLNVYAPFNSKANKSGLPVLVWIHGGGYGLGDGTQDMTEIINANENGFVAVSIQYRLGAFGWLSSRDVKIKGALNAGLLDMLFSLEWVQKHISRFGGDPRKVTVSGESAGGGAVMLLGMAYGGMLGEKLFRSGIAASPYLPAQYNHDAAVPTARYNDFASKAGCGNVADKFSCLTAADSMTLQQANSDVSTTQTYGTWAFIPVTDGEVVQSLPSAQLQEKKVNGANILVGNNANEGAMFVPTSVTTLVDLKSWLKLSYPTFNDSQISNILAAYPSSDNPVDPNEPCYATTGLGPATAVNVSQLATGQLQRSYNILAESTFVCPSYWLNNAYTRENSRSYHYQYSIPVASHGDDVAGYFGPAGPNLGSAFLTAFRKIWGSFIITGVPTIVSSSSASVFPTWKSPTGIQMLNLNQTSGTPYAVVAANGASATRYQEPGLKNKFDVVSAFEWEGGRGQRCEFWRGIAGSVPM